MKITCLVEDTNKHEFLEAEHGVSFYVEMENHKLLFDVGKTDLFIKNAKLLNIDLSKVDTVVISHGHYDHGGGLFAFMKINQTAKIYISEHAFQNYYSRRSEDELVYIGLDQNLKSSKQFIFVRNQLKIDQNLTIFSDVYSQDYYPRSNQTLYKKINGKYENDDFIHEQNLIINENHKFVLFAGCAHHGIINIVKRASELISPKKLTSVLGGFHLSSRFPEFAETENNIKEISSILLNYQIMCYTGHCTGIKQYHILKKHMKNHIDYFSVGFQTTI